MPDVSARSLHLHRQERPAWKALGNSSETTVFPLFYEARRFAKKAEGNGHGKHTNTPGGNGLGLLWSLVAFFPRGGQAGFISRARVCCMLEAVGDVYTLVPASLTHSLSLALFPFLPNHYHLSSAGSQANP